MAQAIHKIKPLNPKLSFQMQNMAHVFLNSCMKRLIPKELVQTPEDARFNLFIKTKALIAHDRVLIYGAAGD